MLLGDEFTTKVWLKDLVEHQTRFAGTLDPADLSLRILQSAMTSWWPRAIAGAFAPSATRRASAAPSTPRSRRRTPAYYTRDDLTKIFALYEAEEVRGAKPRYFEDVKAGEKLQTMVKGPMTVTGFIAFAQGWGGLYIRANKLAWKQLQKHPGLGIANKFGIPDVPERVHWEDDHGDAGGNAGGLRLRAGAMLMDDASA